MPLGVVPFPFGYCRICKDRATGVHYGVATCEGCKGFFKRSITRGDKYKCFFGGECDVTPKNRNRCKSCRFRLCLETGMSVEGVRMGRIPKVEKEKALEAFYQGGADYSHMELTVHQTGSGTYDFHLDPKEDVQQEGIEKFDELGINNTPVDTTEHTNDMPDGPEYYACPRPNLEVKGENLNSVQVQFSNEIPFTLGNQGSEGPPVQFRSLEPTYQRHPQCASEVSLSILPSSTVTSDSLKQESDLSGLDNDARDDIYTFSSQQNVGDESLTFPGQFKNPQPVDKRKYTQLKNIGESDTQFEDSQEPVRKYSRFHRSVSENISTQTQSLKGFSYNEGNNSFFRNVGEKDTKQGQVDQIQNSLNSCNNVIDLAQSNVILSSPATEGSCLANLYSHCSNLNLITGNYTNPFVSSSHLHELKTEPIDETSEQHDMEILHKNNTSEELQRIKKHPNKKLHSDNLDNESFYQEDAPSRPQLLSKIENSKSSSKNTSDAAPVLLCELPSYPPPCPTPSSLQSCDGSNGSSQRSHYSPALIKVLIDQLIDSTQGGNVAAKLQQRFEQTQTDQNVVQTVIRLIHEASAKKSSSALSKSMSPDHSSNSDDVVMSLPENKLEGIHRFLKDVDLFSRYDDLQSKGANVFKRRLSHGLNETFEHLDMRMPDQSKGWSPCHHDIDLIWGPVEPRQHGVPADYREANLPTCASSLDRMYNRSESPSLTNENSSCHLVTSSGKDLEKEIENEQILLTLSGLNLAMKILYRLKPEHRERLRLYKLGQINIRVMTGSDADVKAVYEKIFGNIPLLNERILGFCEHVPGFTGLLKEDRDLMMKRAYYDIWMLTFAEYFYEGKSYMILSSGEIYSAEAMRRILNEEMVETIMSFAEEFNALNLTDLEISILCAIQLTSTDGIELQDRDAVQRLHSHLLDVLAFEVKQNHEDSHSRLLIDIFRIMPLLAIINSLQKQIISTFALNRYKEDKSDKEVSEQHP